MPGQGPLPKPPGQRARRNRPEIAGRTVMIDPSAQPELPSIEIEKNGKLTEWAWPVRTVEWWAMWGRSPLADEFTETDWDVLMDTALLHARYWRGDTSVAAELRIRVAKFGATPEDRARLRITFAQADKAEDDAPAPSVRTRRPLTDAA